MGNNQTNTDQDLRKIGTLAYRAVARTTDMNAIHILFGGAMLSYLDLAGAALANQAAGKQAVLVNVDKTSFKKPIYVGQGIDIYGKIFKTTKTSITFHLQAWKNDRIKNKEELSTESYMTYVYVDEKNRPIRVRLKENNLNKH